MTTTFVWTELKKLAVLDYDIHCLQQACKKEEATLRALHTAAEKEASSLHDIETTLRILHKELDAGELEAKSLASQIAVKKRQLESLASPKERVAQEHDIARLASARDTLDTRLLTLIDQMTAVQHTLSRQKEEAAANTVLRTHAQEAATATITRSKAEIAAREAEWQASAPQVPEQLRAEYVQLKKRMPNPAAPINGQACSACFETLLHQELSSLTTRSVIRCRGCYRFLYIPDASTAQLGTMRE